MSVHAARVALVGLANNWGEEFCRAVYRAEFGEGRRIDDSDLLAPLLAGLGVDPAPALSAAQSPEIKSRLRQQSEEAQRLGLFGAPNLVTADGEISGAMTGWKRPLPGREERRLAAVTVAGYAACGRVSACAKSPVAG